MMLRTLALGLCLTACGQATQKNEAPAAQQPAPQTEEAAPALPAGLLVKVDVDAEGNEIPGSFETRSIETAGQSFDSGTVLKVTVDELDQGSSTESYHRGSRLGWYASTPWYPGKLLGRGLLWGRNPYTYYYGGSSYGYGYSSHYSYGKSNYYYYTPSYGSYGSYGNGGYGQGGYGNGGQYGNGYGNGGKY